MAALILTAEQVFEVYGKKSHFRPLKGTAPWHEEKREWQWHKPDYPVNYKVPNFGVDRDIVTSQQNEKNAETTLKHKWNPQKNKEGGYVLPTATIQGEAVYNPSKHSRAQVSADDEYLQTQAESDPICHSAGCTQYKHPKPDKKTLYPMDYPVPNFGRDPDIITTFNSLDHAERARQHKWVLGEDWKKKEDDPIEYDFNPDLDDDIEMTNEHMEQAEKKLGKWDYKALQVDGKNELYTEDQFKELMRQHSLVQSDPICNSVGCTQYLHPKDKSKDYPKDYKVPNFGLDQDNVITTFNSLDVAEAMRQHRWNFSWDNVPKPEEPTKYNDDPDLDQDIIDTQGHVKLAAEKFMVKQDAKKAEAKKEDKKEEKKEDKKEEEKKEEKKDDEKKEDDKKEEEKKDDDKKEEKKEEEKKEEAKVQVEEDLRSDPICHSAGCTQYLHPKPDKKDLYPMDYPVPNFGRDHDILTTWNSLDVAEAIRQHRWVLGEEKKKEDPIVYNYTPDLDDDIEMTHDHMEQAEKKLGKWDYKALQLDSETDMEAYNQMQIKELMRQHSQNQDVNPAYNNPIALAKLTSDPIFGSADTPLDEHTHADGGRKIIEYPDPDAQGLDEDIRLTQKNLVSSQQYWKHTWKYNMSADMPNFAIPGKPEYDGENRTNLKLNGPWHIPLDKTKAGSTVQKANQPVPAAPAAPANNNSAPAPAQAQVAKVTVPAQVQKSNDTHNNTAAPHAAVQTKSRAEVRQELQNQISQLQMEIESIWKLQQEKETKLHQLQSQLFKENMEMAKVPQPIGTLIQQQHKHHHRHHHHHTQRAAAPPAAASGNGSNASQPAAALVQNMQQAAVKHHHRHHHHHH